MMLVALRDKMQMKVDKDKAKRIRQDSNLRPFRDQIS